MTGLNAPIPGAAQAPLSARFFGVRAAPIVRHADDLHATKPWRQARGGEDRHEHRRD
jgi:hypothetical protein